MYIMTVNPLPYNAAVTYSIIQFSQNFPNMAEHELIMPAFGVTLS